MCRLWLLAAVAFAPKHRSFNALRARSKPPPFPALGSLSAFPLFTTLKCGWRNSSPVGVSNAFRRSVPRHPWTPACFTTRLTRLHCLSAFPLFTTWLSSPRWFTRRPSLQCLSAFPLFTTSARNRSSITLTGLQCLSAFPLFTTARFVTHCDAEGKNTQRSEVDFRPRQCAGYGCLPPLRLPPNIAASTLCA